MIEAPVSVPVPASAYQNITLTDMQLASAYYPILLELALQRKCLTYTELVETAKRRYPDRLVVRRAMAISAARRLEVIRLFTVERNLPDISALIVNKDTGKAGNGFNITVDPKHNRDRVYAYDWSTVSSDFDGFVHVREKTLTRRKKVAKAKALELMAQYYQSNKTRLPADVRQHREVILELIEEGFEVAEVFDLVLKKREH
jgi:hypothetical protein